MKSLLLFILPIMSVLVTANIASAVEGRPVLGVELRNGLYVPVPLRDDPPPPSRSSRANRGGNDYVPNTQAAPVEQKPNKQQIYREAVQLLKPISNIPETQKYPTRGSVVLKPTGTAFFNILRQNNGQNYESVAQQLGDTPFAASKSTAEDLYRTAYLLQAAAKSGGAEDTRFLADQAGLAMNAQPILVVIPDRPITGETEQRITRLDQLKSAALEAQNSYVQARLSQSAAAEDRAKANAEVEKLKAAVTQAKKLAETRVKETPADMGRAPDPNQDPAVQQARAALEKAQQDQHHAADAEAKAKAATEAAGRQLAACVVKMVRDPVSWDLVNP